MDLRSATGIPVAVLGVRGESYGISVYGYGDDRKESPNRRSAIIQATAASGMKTIHIAFSARQ
jgi:hypothetical protein